MTHSVAQTERSSAGVSPSGPSASLILAFRRALVSQLHPKMLMALLMPFLIAAAGLVLLLWFFWSPLNGWLEQAMNTQAFGQIDRWLAAIGWISLSSGMAPVLAVFILLPLAGIFGLLIAAVFVMPLVLSFLDKRDYQGLERRGYYANTTGIINAAWVGGAFVLGWVLTLPLWLVPPLALVLPVFWWAFAFSRMLRVDALVEHATMIERKQLWRRYNRHYWFLGLCMALLNLLPPLWLVLPVFSALVFAHFSLDALQQLRKASQCPASAPVSSVS